jgi:hypothetical protein
LTYGCSTGIDPAIVNKMNRAKKVRSLDDLLIVKLQKMVTLATKASTPAVLLGMHRRIAYANKKYHSGLICRGVLVGAAIR